MSFDVQGILMALTAQADQQPVVAAPGGQGDFRWYVWAAYGAVILLLLLFSLWSTVQLRGAERRLDRIEELLERAKGEKPAVAKQA